MSRLESAPRIDASLVARLVAAQFPAWASLPVRPVSSDGWDNRTFQLGEQLSVRLPSAAGYAPQVAKEVAWLPTIARGVSLPVPEVVGVGEPDLGYAWPWTIRRWIDGTPASTSERADDALVLQLAAFLRQLEQLTAEGPGPGQHSAGRGAPLAQWDVEVRSAAARLAHRIDASTALERWDRAVGAEAGSADRVWFHGDIAPGNLLCRGGRLAAVIDFGLAGVGDPSCDLAIAWSWFDDSQRRVFRRATRADGARWERGAGWALWKALITLEDPARAADAARTLTALGIGTADPPGSSQAIR